MKNSRFSKKIWNLKKISKSQQNQENISKSQNILKNLDFPKKSENFLPKIENRDYFPGQNNFLKIVFFYRFSKFLKIRNVQMIVVPVNILREALHQMKSIIALEGKK